jgi:hypothetical protein
VTADTYIYLISNIVIENSWKILYILYHMVHTAVEEHGHMHGHAGRVSTRRTGRHARACSHGTPDTQQQHGRAP